MAKLLLAVLWMSSMLAAQESPTCTKCGKQTYGTSVQWVGTPSQAATKAKAEQKLVFVLHVSGYFEDPTFT